MFRTHSRTAAKSCEQDLLSLLPSRSNVLFAIVCSSSARSDCTCQRTSIAIPIPLHAERGGLQAADALAAATQNWQPIYHRCFAENRTTAHKLKQTDCHEDLSKQPTDWRPVIKSGLANYTETPTARKCLPDQKSSSRARRRLPTCKFSKIYVKNRQNTI